MDPLEVGNYQQLKGNTGTSHGLKGNVDHVRWQETNYVYKALGTEDPCIP